VPQELVSWDNRPQIGQISVGNGNDTLRVQNNALNRATLLVGGGGGSDTVLLGHNELSRTEVSVQGGADVDRLLIAAMDHDHKFVRC
jgi:Ca2+-binding RTX toxin-like protein